MDENGFVNGFSTRLGGVSPFPSGDLNLAGFDDDTAENIHENRRRFLNVFGSRLTMALAWQVHGDAIRVVATPAEIADSETRADAVMSNLSRVLAAVKTADCVPVLIGDALNGAFAAVHAGWRGTARSIVAKTVGEMGKIYSSRPQNLIVAIGPAAAGNSYEVGADVMKVFADAFPDSEKYFAVTREGHALVDLHAANRDQLMHCGVPAEQIYTSPFCTMLRSDLFFSYRLEKHKYGKTGRLLSVIGRNG